MLRADDDIRSPAGIIRNRVRQLGTYMMLITIFFLLFSDNFTETEWIFFGIILFFTAIMIILLYVRLQRMAQQNAAEEFDFSQLPISASQLQYIRLALMNPNRDFTGNDYNDLLALDNDIGRGGLSDVQIQRMPSYIYESFEPPIGAETPAGDENDIVCTICLETLADGDSVRSTPCFHSFHVACIDPWLRQKAICPVCNQRVSV